MNSCKQPSYPITQNTKMDKARILELTKLFFDHHTIHDELIPYFDQNGRWLGDRCSWEHSVSVISRMRMRDAYLRRSRRTRRCRSGTILRTSFLWFKSTPALLTYCAIEGNVFIPARATVHAPNLRDVVGRFYSRTNKAIFTPYLQNVGGDFDVSETCLVRADRLRHVKGSVFIFGSDLPSLTTVGGSLSVKWVFDFRYRKLKSIGGGCELRSAIDVVMPALKSIGGDILIGKAQRVQLSELEFIGGDFLAGCAEELHAPHLISVGGDINSESAVEFYRHTISCGGDWTMCPGDRDKWNIKRALLAIRGIPFSM